MKLWLCVMLISLASCASRQTPACRLDLNLQLFAPWQPRPADIDVALWSGLLLRGVDLDCTGRPLARPAPNFDLLGRPEVQLFPYQQDEWLVWLKTHRAPDGIVSGPLARVKVAYENLQVMAIGPLASQPADINCRLVSLPKLTVVEVHNTTCPPGDPSQIDEGSDCEANVQLLVEEAGQLNTAPGGNIALRGRHQVSCGPRCFQPITLQAELTPDPNNQAGYTLHERVTVYDEMRASANKRVLRQSEGTLQVAYDGSKWVSSAPSLWARSHRP